MGSLSLFLHNLHGHLSDGMTHRDLNPSNIKGDLKVYVTQNFFISLVERTCKMMKNGIYFIVMALLVAELFKILLYAN